jgi:hypothetical protein
MLAIAITAIPAWFDSAVKVANQYSLAAYAIAALLAVVGYIARTRLLQRPWLLAVVVAAVVLIVAIPVAALVYIKRVESMGIYRISVTATDSKGLPVEHPNVRASVPAQSYDIGSSVQLEVVPGHLSKGSTLTIYADDPATKEQGEEKFTLGDDWSPSISVPLHSIPSEVRGNVIDTIAAPISEAEVSIAGYNEHTTTDSRGLFVIQTAVPKGDVVYLLVQKAGYTPVRQQHISGAAPATIMLEKSSSRRLQKSSGQDR